MHAPGSRFSGRPHTVIYIHREDGPPATESSFFSLMPMFNKMGRFAEGHNSVCAKNRGKKREQIYDP